MMERECVKIKEKSKLYRVPSNLRGRRNDPQKKLTRTKTEDSGSEGSNRHPNPDECTIIPVLIIIMPKHQI